MKTSELSGAALDWAVAKCEGKEPKHHEGWPMEEPSEYSTDWALGGAIIEREKISVIWMQFSDEQYWLASIDVGTLEAPRECEARGDTPLVAAMRCYVASKLGDNVELPEELK
jgi:hypothetical protein